MKIRGNKGFTLVEMMIVVAIIALLAAIAIPNLLRARHNANESAAIGSLRTISSAEESYRANQNPVTYGTLANLLAPPNGGPAYIDQILAGGAKQGYNFVMSNLSPNTYTVTASPQVAGQTGTRTFTVDQTGVVWDVTNNRPIE